MCVDYLQMNERKLWIILSKKNFAKNKNYEFWWLLWNLYVCLCAFYKKNKIEILVLFFCFLTEIEWQFLLNSTLFWSQYKDDIFYSNAISNTKTSTDRVIWADF